ncbi:DUF6384 family protein [Pseudomonas taiwanensis]|uniref:DUF6384 family protein n=1 Tax=Pseudomonas taiwanensis TaxID=470150 RepID=UPI0028DD6F16|nr:DUF6384 family protein [Pseudomonas taiwanensis]MDT8925362.1 DUF6384 family protein [Pseudomonas taiwanensis]
MAIAASIDNIRHERLSLEKHLNLHQDRQALEAEFAAFYRRNGVEDVTPEMIEKAVAAYKKDRFTYKGWSGSNFSRSLASAYLWAQPQWKKITLIAVSVVLGGVLLSTGATKLFIMAHNMDLELAAASIQQDAENFRQSLAKLEKEITEHQQWLNSLNEKGASTALLLHQQLAAVNDQLTVLIQLRDEISAWGKTGMVVDKAMVEKDPIAAKKVWEATTHTRVASYRNELSTARSEMAKRVSVVEALKSTSEQLAQVRASALYASYANEPDIAFKLSRAEMDFSQGRVTEARAGVEQLNQLLQGRQNAKQLIANVQALQNQVEPIFKDAEGKARLNKLMAQAQLAAQQGNKDSYTRITDQVSALADYVATPLHLEITTSSAGKSGIEREYHENGQSASTPGPKRWYLVVRAVDATGKARAMDITNIETKKVERVSLWAQEVSKKGYDAVKKDKIADGILDNTNVGDKPSGYYEFNYTMPMLNGTLTRW